MQPNRPYEAGFAGVGLTYARLPLELDPAGWPAPTSSILGAPFDEGVSYRPGTRFGPRAIRQAEDVGFPAERPNMELGVDPYSVLKMVDGGDVEVQPSNLAPSHAALQAGVADILAAGAAAVVLGGDHSLSTPVLAAIAGAVRRRRLLGDPLRHPRRHRPRDVGGAARHPVLAGRHRRPPARPQHHADRPARQLAVPARVRVDARAGLPLAHDQRGDRAGIGPVVREAIELARSRAPRTYLTVDIDVLDPAFAPGTGTAEPGGLMTRELLYAVRTDRVRASTSARWTSSRSRRRTTRPASRRWPGTASCYETLAGMALRRSGRQARPERP